MLSDTLVHPDQFSRALPLRALGRVRKGAAEGVNSLWSPAAVRGVRVRMKSQHLSSPGSICLAVFPSPCSSHTCGFKGEDDSQLGNPAGGRVVWDKRTKAAPGARRASKAHPETRRGIGDALGSLVPPHAQGSNNPQLR